MDSAQFPLKSQSAIIRGVRAAMRPIQEAVFLQPDGHRTRANRIVAQLEKWLASV